MNQEGLCKTVVQALANVRHTLFEAALAGQQLNPNTKFDSLIAQLCKFNRVVSLPKELLQICQMEKNNTRVVLEQIESVLYAPVKNTADQQTNCPNMNILTENVFVGTMTNTPLLSSVPTFNICVTPMKIDHTLQIEMDSLKRTISQLNKRIEENSQPMNDSDLKRQFEKKMKSSQTEYKKKLKMVEEEAYRIALKEQEKRENKYKVSLDRAQKDISLLQQELKSQASNYNQQQIMHEEELTGIRVEFKKQIQNKVEALQTIKEQQKKASIQERDLMWMGKLQQEQEKTQQIKLGYEQKLEHMSTMKVEIIKEIQNTTSNRIQQIQTEHSKKIKKLKDQLQIHELEAMRLKQNFQNKRQQFFDKNYNNMKQNDQITKLYNAALETIKSHELEIQNLKAEQIEMAEQYRSEISNIKATYSQVLSKEFKLHQDEINKIREEQIQFQGKIKQEMTRLMTRNKEVEKIADDKIKDVMQITEQLQLRLKEKSHLAQRLSNNLLNREQEARQLKCSVKQLKLQLNNKEKMYMKIFSPSLQEGSGEGTGKDSGTNFRTSLLSSLHERQNRVTANPRKGTLSLAYECSKRKGQRKALEGIKQGVQSIRLQSKQQSHY